MDQWERKLATRDTNRVVRPFEWGTDWLNSLEFPGCPADANGNSAECLVALRQQKRWPIRTAFSPTTRCGTTGWRGEPPDIHESGATRHPENNTAHASVVSGTERPRARGDRAAAVEFRTGRACGAGQAAQPVRRQRAAHDDGLPCGAQAGGDAARRLSCVEQCGAHDSCGRQSVLDVRACVDWLERKGYSRIGVLGTSLGSCVAFIAAAHDTADPHGDLQSRLDAFRGCGVDRALDAERESRRSGDM